MKVVHFTVTTSAAARTVARFIAADGGERLVRYLDAAGAVRLQVTLDTPIGPRASTVDALRARRRLHVLQAIGFDRDFPKRPLLLNGAAWFPFETSLVEANLIEDPTARGDEFDQRRRRIEFVERHFGVDLRRLEVIPDASAHHAARALIKLAGLRFDPYAHAAGYFVKSEGPERLAKAGRLTRADVLKVAGALKLMAEQDLVWCDGCQPPRVGGRPAQAAGWLNRSNAQTLERYYNPKQVTRVDAAGPDTERRLRDERMFMDAIDRLEAAGYVWDAGWSKR